MRADAWTWAACALLGGAVLSGGLYLAGDAPRERFDERALVLAARADMEAQRWDAAAAGFAKALQAQGKVARDAGVWVEYAEATALRQGGELRGEPRRLLQRALDLQAAHPRALELAGSAAWEAGEFEQATRLWRQLLETLPADDPRREGLLVAVRNSEKRARLALR